MDSCNNMAAKAQPVMDWTSYQNREDHFTAHNNIFLTGFNKDGRAQGELRVAKTSLNPLGIVHGGCLATLADSVAGYAAIAATGRQCVTVNYALNFIRPAKGSNKKIVCLATPRRLGRTLCVYEIKLLDDEQEVVATGDFTFCATKEFVKVPELPPLL